MIIRAPVKSISVVHYVADYLEWICTFMGSRVVGITVLYTQFYIP